MYNAPWRGTFPSTSDLTPANRLVWTDRRWTPWIEADPRGDPSQAWGRVGLSEMNARAARARNGQARGWAYSDSSANRLIPIVVGRSADLKRRLDVDRNVAQPIEHALHLGPDHAQPAL